MASRYRNSSPAVASAGGAATFTFQSPPPGVVVTGSLGIPDAPSTAVATVTIGGVVWGAWGGNATFGPVQQFAAELVSVDVSGLTPGAAYNLVFIGVAEDEQAAQIIWPSAIATALTTTSVSVPAFHGACIAAAANQNILNGADDQVTLAASIFDSDAYAATASQFTIPASKAGTYLVIWQVSWVNGGVSTGQVVPYLEVNGVLTSRSEIIVLPTEMSVTLRQTWNASALLALAVGDVVRLHFSNGSGATVALDGAAGDNVPRSSMSIALVGV